MSNIRKTDYNLTEIEDCEDFLFEVANGTITNRDICSSSNGKGLHSDPRHWSDEEILVFLAMAFGKMDKTMHNRFAYAAEERKIPWDIIETGKMKEIYLDRMQHENPALHEKLIGMEGN